MTSHSSGRSSLHPCARCRKHSSSRPARSVHLESCEQTAGHDPELLSPSASPHASLKRGCPSTTSRSSSFFPPSHRFPFFSCLPLSLTFLPLFSFPLLPSSTFPPIPSYPFLPFLPPSSLFLFSFFSFYFFLFLFFFLERECHLAAGKCSHRGEPRTAACPPARRARPRRCENRVLAPGRKQQQEMLVKATSPGSLSPASGTPLLTSPLFVPPRRGLARCRRMREWGAAVRGSRCWAALGSSGLRCSSQRRGCFPRKTLPDLGSRAGCACEPSA